MAASECVPFCKTGGLADVAGALPPALTRRKVQVRLVLPKYKEISASRFHLKKTRITLRLPIGGSLETAEVWEGKLGPQIPVYFIDNPKYFHRDHLYTGPDGQSFPDNDERFILFSRAVLETSKAIDFRPDIIHCHDWQTALIPAYLSTLYGIDAFFTSTASLLTVHNIAYQGIFPKTSLLLAGFSSRDFTPDRLEYYGQMNFLKAGLVYANVLNTVSPTYAREIRENPEFGCGMEGLLRARQTDLYGILNGLDTRQWDPSRDSFLKSHFSSRNPGAKRLCKKNLQKKLGLREEPESPLIGVVSRLDLQKGLDLVAEAAEEILSGGAQMAMLGNGNPALRKRLEELERRIPRQFVIRTGFEEPLAHQIYAGSDLFLMPSRFEPCGLSQMIAMRYGSIPVVTRRGGLADTVEPCSAESRKGTGFVIQEPSAAALKLGVKTALELFRDKKTWDRLIHRAMGRNFSWSRPVKDYLALYKRALQKRATAPPYAP
jgi:starch synthase